MRNDDKLQIPINNKLKKALKKKSEELGFSSVNEVARVLLQNFATGNIILEFMGAKQNKQTVEFLDTKTEARLNKSMEDYKSGDYETITMGEAGEIDNWLDNLDA